MGRELKLILTSQQYEWLKINIKQNNTEDSRCVDFDEDGESITIRHIFDEDKRVQDGWRYVFKKNELIIEGSESTSAFCSRFNDQKVQATKKNPQILLLLESPHKDEYYYKLTTDGQFLMVPVGPAQGNTGSRIHNQLAKKLAKLKLLRKVSYDIIISNPVQFQASLYCLHGFSMWKSNAIVGEIRNSIWRAIVDDERKEIVNRLNSYMPKVIINSCTKELCGDVDDLVFSAFFDEQNTISCLPKYFHASSHPCNWSSKTKIHEIYFND